MNKEFSIEELVTLTEDVIVDLKKVLDKHISYSEGKFNSHTFFDFIINTLCSFNYNVLMNLINTYGLHHTYEVFLNKFFDHIESNIESNLKIDNGKNKHE